MSTQGSAAVSSFLKAAVDRGDVPGVVALVVGRDGVLYHEAFGMQDAGRRVPMSKDTIFRIASMTKPVTSLAVLMLIEEGKLGLRDEVAKYLPAWQAPKVIASVDTAKGTFTSRPAARQLVRHGHFTVNGRKVNIPSFSVKPGDVVAIRESSRTAPSSVHALEEVKGRGVPEWLQFDAAALSAKIGSVPTREQINLPVQEQLIVELYSK